MADPRLNDPETHLARYERLYEVQDQIHNILSAIHIIASHDGLQGYPLSSLEEIVSTLSSQALELSQTADALLCTGVNTATLEEISGDET